MAKYRVWARSISDCYIDIEASSEDKARELADKIDGGDFHSTVDGDWEWAGIDELPENTKVDYLEEDFE